MDHDEAKTLEQLMEPGSTLMVGVESPEESLSFRPLTVARVAGSTIDILLDTREEWVRSLQNGARAHVTLSDNRTNTWVSLRGSASVSTDSSLIDELWNPAAGSYFEEGRETPGIAALRIDGDTGTYWTTHSGRLGALISMVKARFGSPEDSGERGDVAL